MVNVFAITTYTYLVGYREYNDFRWGDHPVPGPPILPGRRRLAVERLWITAGESSARRPLLQRRPHPGSHLCPLRRSAQLCRHRPKREADLRQAGPAPRHDFVDQPGAAGRGGIIGRPLSAAPLSGGLVAGLEQVELQFRFGVPALACLFAHRPRRGTQRAAESGHLFGGRCQTGGRDVHHFLAHARIVARAYRHM